MLKRFVLTVYICHEVFRSFGQVQDSLKIDDFSACSFYIWE